MTQETRRYRFPCAAIAALSILHLSAPARAQQPLPPGSAVQPAPSPQPLPPATAAPAPPGQPPPGQPPPGQPPPGYGQPPPPGYGQPPPPGYGQPPPPGYGPPPGYPPPYGYGPPPGYPSPYGYGPPSPDAYGPKTREYKEGEPIPPGYHLETRGATKILVAGIAIFGGLYIASALVGGTFVSEGGDEADELGPLLIPLVGPFVTMGTSGVDPGEQSGQAPFILLLFDGLGQTAGLVMTIYGLAAPDTKRLVRNDQGSERSLAPEVLVGASSGSLRWRF